MRRLLRLRQEEDGVVLVTALMVTFVVFLLSIVVVQQSIHNLEASGRDRERLTAVSAAEAGLDWAYNRIENTPIASLWQGAAPGTVGSGPSSVSYSVEPHYFVKSDGTGTFTGTPSVSNYPRSVLITSTATAADGATRVMESFAVLNPVYGGVNGAIITQNGMTVAGTTFTVNGNPSSGNDGDIILNSGDLSITSGNPVIHGNIYVVDGEAIISARATIYGQVWANSSVTLGQSQVVVNGDVKSTTSLVDATRYQTIGGTAFYCTSLNGTVVRSQKTCLLGRPPSQEFPLIRYDPDAWSTQGYSYVKDFSASGCVSARQWIENTGPGTYNAGFPGGDVPAGTTGVIVITPSSCQYATAPASSKIKFGTNLALLAYGGISLGNNTEWCSTSSVTGACGTGSKQNVFLMSPYDGVAPHCPIQNITISNQNKFTNVNLSVYSPCTVSVDNNNGFDGQVLGAQVTMTNAFKMTYWPILIPGTVIVGFKQDVAYIRETQAA